MERSSKVRIWPGGLQTAYVNVAEENNMAQCFEQPDDSHFDIEAQDFENLYRKLKVSWKRLHER